MTDTTVAGWLDPSGDYDAAVGGEGISVTDNTVPLPEPEQATDPAVQNDQTTTTVTTVPQPAVAGSPSQVLGRSMRIHHWKALGQSALPGGCLACAAGSLREQRATGQFGGLRTPLDHFSASFWVRLLASLLSWNRRRRQQRHQR